VPPPSGAPRGRCDGSRTALASRSPTSGLRSSCVGASCRDDVFEDNDFDDEPAPIAPGSYAGLRACHLDADWYAFSVSDGDTITVTIDTHEYTCFRRMVIREPGGEQVWAKPLDLEAPVSTVSLPVTAAGTARVMCVVWSDGVVYDMTIGLD
jgi:hypothetical protein